MTLDTASSTLSPLPDVLSHGLVAVSTFGLLSFFCSTSLFLYLTWRLISWRLKRTYTTPPNQFLLLIYNLLLADIQQACAFLLNISALRNNAIVVGTPTCWAQGWFVSTGDLSSSVFICAIAVHTFFSVVKNYRPRQAIFYYCIVACWTFTYTLGAIGPILRGDEFYARASAWCWINTKYSNERLWLHYFWIFIALVSTILIYTYIIFHLRSSHHPQAAPLMILYPLIYTICTAPLAGGRIYALAGHNVSLGYFCMAGTMIACNGWLDVLLYASTRAEIVFSEFPPGEETGIDTFAFLGKRGMGNTTTIEAGGHHGRRGSRIGRGRDRTSGSVENLYGLNQIAVKGEVIVSVDHLTPADMGSIRMGAGSSVGKSRSWDSRSMKSKDYDILN